MGLVAVVLRDPVTAGQEDSGGQQGSGGKHRCRCSDHASVAGQIGGAATGPAYVAAKAGMIGLTKSLSRHFAKARVRVNCVAPADIETDMTSGWPDDLRQRLVAMTPLGRFGQVDEVSSAVLFLAGGGASFITGQTINVNGGIYMG